MSMLLHAPRRQRIRRAIKGLRQRRLHRAALRYHNPENWPVLRDALEAMGRADLIGPRPDQLVP